MNCENMLCSHTIYMTYINFIRKNVKKKPESLAVCGNNSNFASSKRDTARY